MSDQDRSLDEAKFFTQKAVTFFLLVIFAGVVATVLYQADQSERSMVLQTVINLTLLAVGYWLGSSKGAADTNETMGKIAKAAPAVSAAAVAAAVGAPPPAALEPIKAAEVNIETETTNVNQGDKP